MALCNKALANHLCLVENLSQDKENCYFSSTDGDYLLPMAALLTALVCPVPEPKLEVNAAMYFVQRGSRQPSVTTGTRKRNECNEGTEFFILFN